MPNMGYVAFENTLEDLQDCYNRMENDLSEREQKYKNRLIKLCKKIATEYDCEKEKPHPLDKYTFKELHEGKYIA